MRKATKLYALLGVLLVVCIAAFAVSRYEEKKEQIKNSGEVILEIPTDSVTALSWTNESGTFSFTKDETWVYDDDNAFPVDEEKINDLLEQFTSFAAAFAIDDVEGYAQYGLDEPICTIHITAGEESYTVELGDFSKMDEQRYVSIGDGKVYLVSHDPLDEFDSVLRDMILDDTIPEFDTAKQIAFTGSENYTISYDEETKSICADDVYFTDGKPLDTAVITEWLTSLHELDLTNYVSYNVTDEELETFGLDEPALAITLDYSSSDEDGNETDSGTLVLHLSQNPEELAAYEEAIANEEDVLPDVTCYARVGDSQIVYQITQSEFDALTDVSYDALRHQKIFTADFDTVTSIDVTLEGEDYIFTYNPPEDEDDADVEGTWTYQDTEFDIFDFSYALRALSATSFTDEAPTGQEEISLTLHLDNKDFPTFTLTLYRLDGENKVEDGTNSFTDLQKDAYYTDAVNWAAEQGVVNGYPDGTFGPDRNMTRAEVAQMFYALLNDQNVPATVSFSDVPDGAWYADAVETLASLGMFTGYPDGTFHPNSTITRAEFAAAALSFADMAPSARCSFPDVSAQDWFYPYVASAAEYGWIGGYPDGTFRPSGSITRAEVAVIVNHMLGRTPDQSFVDRSLDRLVSFSDLNSSHWAFYPIMEASNSHGHIKAGGSEQWTGINN